MDWILLAQDTAVDEVGEELSQLDALLAIVMTPIGYVLVSAACMAIGIYLLLPPRGRGKQFLIGALLAAVSVVLFLIPTIGKLPTAPVFFLLEGLAVLGGLGTITARSPVYSAIWFASALLAIGAILLIGGAQFLGLATVAVYAGAIVVTFLFVLMLAQPEGHAVYDRIGWGWFPSLCASIAGVSIVAIIAAGLLGGLADVSDSSILQAKVTKAIGDLMTQSANFEDAPHPNPTRERGSTAGAVFPRSRVGLGSQRKSIPSETAKSVDGSTATIDTALPDASRYAEDTVLDVQLTRDANGASLLNVTLSPDSGLLANGDAVIASTIRTSVSDIDPATKISIREKDILASDHVARLGGALFGRHLIAIQVAGVLLLVALVGAIAMAIHGKDLSPHIPSRKVATR